MAKEKELSRLNPDIQDCEIGTKRLYNLTIYPLAFGQQFELSDIITASISAFYQGSDISDIAIVAMLVKLVQEHAGRILEYVTDADQVQEILEDADQTNILNMITNKQMVTIAEALYKYNFDDVSKKVGDLFRKMKEEHRSERSSPDSSEGSLNTDLPIFSPSPTRKEDLQ